MKDSLYQRNDEIHAGGEDLGHIVVDDARDVDDDIRHIGNQLRQSGDQAVEQLGNAVKTYIHKLPRVGAQLLSEREQLRQGIGQKIRDVLIFSIYSTRNLLKFSSSSIVCSISIYVDYNSSI